MTREVTYDPACERLARHFLQDEKDVTEADVRELAGLLQLTIEDWIQERAIERETKHGQAAT